LNIFLKTGSFGKESYYFIKLEHDNFFICSSESNLSMDKFLKNT